MILSRCYYKTSKYRQKFFFIVQLLKVNIVKIIFLQSSHLLWLSLPFNPLDWGLTRWEHYIPQPQHHLVLKCIGITYELVPILGTMVQTPADISNQIGNGQFINQKLTFLSNYSANIRVIGHIELKTIHKRWSIQ